MVADHTEFLMGLAPGRLPMDTLSLELIVHDGLGFVNIMAADESFKNRL